MLQLKNITKDYKIGNEKVHALRGVSIDFRESEFVSVLGQSGCGKTTLLNIIGGLDRYTDGDLIIGGKSTNSKAQIGIHTVITQSDSYSRAIILYRTRRCFQMSSLH